MEFLALLRISFRRSHLLLLALLAIGAILLTDLGDIVLPWRPGPGTTWYWIGGTGTYLMAMFPFLLFYSCWYGGISHRNNTEESEQNCNRFIAGAHAVRIVTLLASLMFIAIVIYAWISARIVRHSINVSGSLPEGTYPWQPVLVMILALAAAAIWSYWLGYRFSSVLVPLVAAAGAFLLIQLPREISEPGKPVSPLAAVIPTRLTREMAPYIGDDVYPKLFLWATGWFVVAAVAGILVIVSRKDRRSISGIAMWFALLLAMVCGANTMSAFSSAGDWHAENRKLNCVERSNLQFCGPPNLATIEDMNQVADVYEQLVPVWFPQNLMPTRFIIVIDMGQLPSDAVAMSQFQYQTARNPTEYLKATTNIVSSRGEVLKPLTLPQLVVGCAMLMSMDLDCGPSYPASDYQYVPNAQSSAEGQALIKPFMEAGNHATAEDEQELNSNLEVLQNQTQEKLDNFMALSDAQKTAWLEANWDRLSSGELTLDEMP